MMCNNTELLFRLPEISKIDRIFEANYVNLYCFKLVCFTQGHITCDKLAVT